MKVEDVMNRKVKFIDPNASVLDAIERIIDERIRSLVVKPERKDDTFGVVAVRDIVFKCLAKGLDPKQVKVKEIASKPLIYVEKDMSIEHVLKLMERFNIARVFVKEGDEIIGVIALMDIMSAFIINRVK